MGQRQRQQQAAPSSTQQKWRVLWEFVTEMLSEPAALDSHPVQGDTAAASCPQQHHDVSPSANAHASFLYEPSSQDVHEPAVAGLDAMIEGKGTAESMAGMHWIEAAREAELGQRRKRLSLGFYWTWVKRLLLARIVVGLLSNR